MHAFLSCRKTIKATVVLLPLLGMTNLLFFMKPRSSGAGQVAYHVVNAILPPCQVCLIGYGHIGVDVHEIQ